MESRQLENSEKISEIQINAVYQFIGLLSPEGIVVEVNQTALFFAGLEADDVIGKPVWETYWWNYSEEVQEQLKHAIANAASGKLIRYEVEVRGEKDKRITVDFSLEPIFDTHGNVIWILPEGRDITAQKYEQEVKELEYQKLQASHNMLKSIINSTSDLIGAIDSNYNFTLFNDAYRKEIHKLFGVEVAQGMKMHQVVKNHPEYLEDALSLWGNALSGDSFTVTRMYHHLEGYPVYYEYTFNPIYDQEGKVSGAVQVIRNQTERIMAEQEIKDMNEIVLLAEVIPQKVWSSKPDGKNDYVNNRFLTYTGLTFEQMMGAGWEKMVHPDDLPKALQKWVESLQTGKTYEVEYRLRNKDGEYLWHLGRSIPMRDNKGEIIKWMGTATNIHKRKLLEQAVKEKVEEFEFLIDFIPHIVWKALPDGEVVFYNKQWFKFTGISQEEGAKGLWKMSPHPEDRERTLEAWNKSVETGENYHIEHRIAGKDGIYRWMQSRALPLKDHQDNILMWYGTATDIHDEKNYLEELVWIQKQLHERNKELTRINVDLDNFVYTASHDLRTPILNLASLLSLLQEELEAKEEEDTPTAILNMMKQSIDRLEKTINELSEIAKLQKEKENIEEVSFQEMYEEVYHDLKHMIEKTGAEVHTDFQRSHIYYPPKHLRSVLYNLFSNAVKYAAPKRKPLIKIGTHTKENKICLTVEDNGLGLDKRQQNKLFQMFTRIHTHVEGTGVGLYMIKRIVENNGGNISVESEPERGTTFTVCFKA
ncbi:PAS domain S-box-containing protein [Catalinimonas alkaloidigena]|uniref:PAS domain-containing sensor histidine kinase n=1 Tax=Catalinimonas alkaloidigena TaxID=1075417 RepID=UPI002404D368|nr:PAS domain S-box protein [Catalinimonas alkaloidigena]MDF9800478.1 PAS domain S-box-containing protein [Catalinimonas alkaloidigena]